MACLDQLKSNCNRMGIDEADLDCFYAWLFAWVQPRLHPQHPIVASGSNDLVPRLLQLGYCNSDRGLLPFLSSQLIAQSEIRAAKALTLMYSSMA